ncbi:MAG: MCE family protein [Selenomonadaceae bacterium]|nr:MCE family protein [Selenomonadaceae bacterium]
MSVEAKVGAFAVGGLSLLSAALIGLGGMDLGGSEKITLYAGFKQVLGLENQADVRLSGVNIGRVDSIVNDSGGVTVTLKVDGDTKIPDNSVATVMSIGVMGNKFVNITPGRDEGSYLQDGDNINVTDETDMNKVFESLDKVMTKVDTLLESVNKVIGNETLQNSIVEMSDNMKQSTEHINGLTESLERMAKGNEQNVNQMATQLNSVLASMNKTMATVEHMTANIDKFAGDPQTAADLKTTLSNISATSKSIASVAENIDKFTGDPKVAEDMKATISNARSITERADKMLGKVEGTADKVSKIEFTPSVDVIYSGSHSKTDFNVNANLEVALDDTSINLGVEDIGDGSKLNAQLGKKLGESFGARAGVVAGKIGVGLDAYAGDKLKFSAEAYDPNDVSVRLKSQYKVADSTYILGEWHDVNHKDDRAVYFGIRQEF